MKFINLILTLFVASTFVSCAKKQKMAGGPDKKVLASLPPACSDSVCQLRVEGYPQEIAVLIPPYADFKQVTIFLHGFSFGKARDKNLTAIMNDFEIAKAFKESNTNRILIVPFSAGQNKDYRKYIKNKSDLQAFLNNLYRAFALKVSVEDIHLVGHSGSFVTIQDLVQDRSANTINQKITQVTLLDATYSQFKPSAFTEWLRSGEHKMTVIYLKNSPTQKKALELWGRFSKDKPGQSGGFNLAGGDYLTMIPEAELPLQTESHWLLVRKWFPRIL